jgi:hypothetical protein
MRLECELDGDCVMAWLRTPRETEIAGSGVIQAQSRDRLGQVEPEQQMFGIRIVVLVLHRQAHVFTRNDF